MESSKPTTFFKHLICHLSSARRELERKEKSILIIAYECTGNSMSTFFALMDIVNVLEDLWIMISVSLLSLILNNRFFILFYDFRFN
jgi:hypothetical protein